MALRNPLIVSALSIPSYKRVASGVAPLSLPVAIELNHTWMEDRDLEVGDLDIEVSLVNIGDVLASGVVGVEPVQAVSDETKRIALATLSVPDTIAIGGYFIRIRVTEQLEFEDPNTGAEKEVDEDNISTFYLPFMVVAA